LLQRFEKPVEPLAGPSASDVNAVQNDWRFEHRKLSIDKEASAMVLGDFNGDGRTDIAWFGLPDRLAIRFQPETGEWSTQTNQRLPDVLETTGALAAGDLNHDGKDDLVALGKNVTYILYQEAEGIMAAPQQLMNTSASLDQASIADLDGDGRNDLSYLAQEDRGQLLCARLQDTGGRLGPELRFELKLSRKVALAQVDKQPGREILAIDANTNRLQLLQLRRPEAKPGELAGRLIQYGFGQEGADRDRDLDTGDLDGDGLADVVVTDPEAAQMIVYRQQRDRGLDSGSIYPGLVGASQVRVADLDGNKTAEVVVLSTREKTLALSGLANERLTFPASLPTESEPFAFDLADLNGDGQLEIVYVARDPGNRKSGFMLFALSRDSVTNRWRPFQFGDSTQVNLMLSATPTRLMALDANHDGRPDFLVFAGIDSVPQLFITDGKGIPVSTAGQGGIGLGEITPGAVFVGQLDEPAILVAWKNFARNIRVEPGGQWSVIDQYNAPESNAKIVGAATIDFDGQPGNEVVLVDAGVGKLRVLRRETNLYRPWREVEIGAFPFKSALTEDLNGDGHSDLLLFGRGKFGVVYSGQTDPTLAELASFETRLEKTHFSDVSAGDLNGDGQVDIALIDARSHFIELLDLSDDRKLRHALQFKFFEEKAIAREKSAGTEPRESLVADVTGDGRADLILLSHDRLLLYPQDDGK
jgi:hypothetical protein